jgi:hypothetical protein
MDEAPPLELVDLGDAKQETNGFPRGVEAELNEVVTYRP